MENETAIVKLIERRRRQILVHSYLYYERNANLIDDATWSKWAEELVNLQRQYPDLSSQAPYYEAFKDFDASTGFNLPYTLPNMVSVAEHLLQQEVNAR